MQMLRQRPLVRKLEAEGSSCELEQVVVVDNLRLQKSNRTWIEPTICVEHNHATWWFVLSKILDTGFQREPFSTECCVFPFQYFNAMFPRDRRRRVENNCPRPPRFDHRVQLLASDVPVSSRSRLLRYGQG